MRSAVDLLRLGPPVVDFVGSPNVTCVQRSRSGPIWHLCRAAWRLAKRYMCASRAFPAVETSHDLSIWTRRSPPNVTHVTVSAFRRRFHETLHTQWFPRLFHRKMHLLGSLWAPNLRGRKVWRSCLFATCFQIVCCFKNHQQTQAETFSWLSMDTKYAQA